MEGQNIRIFVDRIVFRSLVPPSPVRCLRTQFLPMFQPSVICHVLPLYRPLSYILSGYKGAVVTSWDGIMTFLVGCSLYNCKLVF